jgi:hypothetical protein
VSTVAEHLSTVADRPFGGLLSRVLVAQYTANDDPSEPQLIFRSAKHLATHGLQPGPVPAKTSQGDVQPKRSDRSGGSAPAGRAT